MNDLSEIVQGKGPAILMGDFNVLNPKELEPLMKKANMDRLQIGATYPTWNPHWNYDNILTRGFDVKKTEVCRDALYSDHLPIFADLCLK